MDAEERPSKIRRLSQPVEAHNEMLSTAVAAINGLQSCVETSQALITPPEEPEAVDDIPNNDLEEAADGSAHDEILDPGTSAQVLERNNLEEPKISKNQLKKLKRKQDWEAGRDFRKAKRKEKTLEKKQHKRAAREQEATAEPTPDLPILDANANANGQPPERQYVRSVQLPITFVFDCGFDDLMLDKERISLAAQLTRCYSDNYRAPFKAHLVISSFFGQLRQRFETVLSGHYQSWKGVRFLDEDFVEAAERATEWMVGDQGGSLAGSFAQKDTPSQDADKLTGEVVYLTSDSPNTLSELKPYSTYIIGGLVDRNRHKGICYKRAMDRDMKTARLPIGEYMEMTSRFVLATNHVSEIMVKWLELGDWGEAFLKVIPKRKGGSLKVTGSTEQNHTAEEDKEVGVAASAGTALHKSFDANCNAS